MLIQGGAVTTSLYEDYPFFYDIGYLAYVVGA
jgi:hypothetical protein